MDHSGKQSKYANTEFLQLIVQQTGLTITNIVFCCSGDILHSARLNSNAQILNSKQVVHTRNLKVQANHCRTCR